MKRAKHEIFISMILIVLSVIFFILFQFDYILVKSCTIRNHLFCRIDIKSFFVTIFSGIFVSALMMLILAIRDYGLTKKEALSEFYTLAHTQQRYINDVLYLDFDYSIDLMMGLISEEYENANRRKYNMELKKQAKNLGKKRGKKHINEFNWNLEFEQRNRFMNTIWDNTDELSKSIILHENKKDEYLKSKYKEKYDNCILMINKVINSYVLLKNQYCDDLTKCISKIDLIFPGLFKRDIYPIYKRIYNQITFIRRIGILCERYVLYGEVDELYLLHFIISCQCSMIDEYDDGTQKFKYNRYAYEIDVALWGLLKIINGKQIDEKPLEKDYWVRKSTYLKPYKELEEINSIITNE